MSRYRITSRSSGHCLGIYWGDNPEAAAEAMDRDAGYDSSIEAADALGIALEDLLADLIIEPVSHLPALTEVRAGHAGVGRAPHRRERP